MPPPQSIALYLHVPFCRHKCAYCDFNSFEHHPERQGEEQVSYVAALLEELRRVPQLIGPGRGIASIFVGGGTPSLLRPDLLEEVLRTAREVACRARAPHTPAGRGTELEFTVEANPGSLSDAVCAVLVGSGCTRLSLGAQSFDDTILRQLDRIHRADEIDAAVRRARRAGVENLNLDLMFGAPGQDLATWRRSLDHAIALEPEHLSLYCLTIEKGTPFFSLQERGALPLPDEEAQLAMYEAAMESAEAAGYEHYEVSNFARPGRRSRHNQLYWENAEYVGCGAGAVSKLNGQRFRNHSKPEHYAAAIRERGRAAHWRERLDADTRRTEAVMLGLRLREGIALRRFPEHHGVAFEEHYARPLQHLVAQGLLELTPERCRLTRRGLFLADAVILELIKETPAEAASAVGAPQAGS
ncbi:MAG: radical SAM family heme chaperone HemW [Candidatus Tectomicrobia bacterium]|nr:radical SAM family heme chaperone HemW [Candidatus Tectomicrobia bacterium]